MWPGHVLLKTGESMSMHMWSEAHTDILACVWRSYTSSRWESPPAPADTAQWAWRPQPEEQPSSCPSLCLPPSRHETPDCCYSPLIRETGAKLSLTIHWSMISSINTLFVTVHRTRHIQEATKTQPNNPTASSSRDVKAFNVLHLNKNHAHCNVF